MRRPRARSRISPPAWRNCWPKKASGVPTDLDGNVVRETGLGAGFVDFKVCSIDDTWSALRFRMLKPGDYTLMITATDSAGRRATTELRFTIVKSSRDR